MKHQITIVDTFPDFEDFWWEYHSKPIEAQIEGWVSRYMARWPDLLRKQTKQYESEKSDWRQIARQRIFPGLPRRISAIRAARKGLIKETKRILRRAQRRFDYPDLPLVVIYVGIGLGAGWATTYQRSPAILFGLENVAEEGWTDAASIRGLIAHELSHHLHGYWRKKAGRRFGSSPLWTLYLEGFADRCERLVLEEDQTHITKGSSDEEWENWCEENKRWLAREFIRRLDKNLDMRPFFGSWLKLRGHSQTGYFLGSEIVERLEQEHSIEEIAGMKNVKQEMMRYLVEFSRSSL